MVVNVYRRPYNELEEINAEIEAQSSVSKVNALTPPKVISTDKRPLKTLTHQEAIMKMELSGDPFLVFKGEEDQKLRVIYKRNDGNYGIMLPE
jgi:putative sigma-54 modulation protein